MRCEIMVEQTGSDPYRLVDAFRDRIAGRFIEATSHEADEKADEFLRSWMASVMSRYRGPTNTEPTGMSTITAFAKPEGP